MGANTKAGQEGRGEGRREKAYEVKERGRSGGGRGTGGRRLWKVFDSAQKPLLGWMYGGNGIGIGE